MHPRILTQWAAPGGPAPRLRAPGG